MRYIFQKLVVILSCCLMAFSPSGLTAMQARNHSAHYFKQIRQLNKKSKQALASNQVFSQPCPISVQQTYKFAKLKTEQLSPQNYEQEYKGPWIPKLTGLNHVFAVLLASYFLIDKVNAQCGDPCTHPHMLESQRNMLKIQQLTRIKFQQELEVLRIERLKMEQNRSEALNMFREQKRVEKLVKIAEQKKLEDLKIQRVQEQKKVEEQKIQQLLSEQQQKNGFHFKIDKPVQLSLTKGPASEKQFAVPEKTKTEIDVMFIDQQHLVYYCSLLELFTIKADTVAVLKQLVGKTTTAEQILIVKHELDRQYIVLACFKVAEKYMSRAQNLKREILNILLTNSEPSLVDVLELTQKLIEYTSFVRNALFMTCELPNTIEERKKETLQKSSQLLAQVKDSSALQNSPAAAFKMFAQDDLEKSIIMVGSDDLTTGGIAYAKGVNKLAQQLLEGTVWKR